MAKAETSGEVVIPAEVVTPTCGIVMPLSAIDGCSADHWADVQAIIKESVENLADPKFSARMVSDADEVGVIQKRIISNIYMSDIVVCDVSAKNPNVMFELGMRLAFDRPAIIIKDDKTSYSFDTGVIEHLTYPRDLRYTTMQAFKQQLAEKVASTYKKFRKDPEHSTFLKSFGTFKVANLHTEEVKSEQLLMVMMEQMQMQMQRLGMKVDRMGIEFPRGGGPDPAYAAAKKIIKEEKDQMSADMWAEVRVNDGFKEFVVSRLSKEFPTRNNLGSHVDRAIRALSDQ